MRLVIEDHQVRQFLKVTENPAPLEATIQPVEIVSLGRAGRKRQNALRHLRRINIGTRGVQVGFIRFQFFTFLAERMPVADGD